MHTLIKWFVFIYKKFVGTIINKMQKILKNMWDI